MSSVFVKTTIHECIQLWYYFGRTVTQKWYRCAYNNEKLYMRFSLYKNNKFLFSRSGYTWWLTGFKPGISSPWDKLKMRASITFPNSTMANSFRKIAGFRPKSDRAVSFTWR